MLKLITPLTQADSGNPQFTVGSRTMTKDGNEYIYLPGVASVAQYDWVTYKTATDLSYGSVTRLTPGDSAGPIAIAQAAITGNKYGWFLIKGMGWGNSGATWTATGSILYACGTTATVDNASTTGKTIIGSINVGAGASGGTVKALINYPFIPGAAI